MSDHVAYEVHDRAAIDTTVGVAFSGDLVSPVSFDGKALRKISSLTKTLVAMPMKSTRAMSKMMLRIESASHLKSEIGGTCHIGGGVAEAE